MTRRYLLGLLPAFLVPGHCEAAVDDGAASLDALRKARFVTTWGKNGSGEGEFDSPIGLAVSRKDEIYVADFKNARVQKFDPNGKLLHIIPTGKEPGGIAVSRDGRIYVGHFGYASGREHVRCFSSNGKLLFDWGKTGKATASSIPPAVWLSARTAASTSRTRPTAASSASPPTASS